MMQVVNWMFAPGGGGGGKSAVAARDPATGAQVAHAPHFNLWRNAVPFELHIYVTEFDDFGSIPDKQRALVWQQHSLRYDWSPENERTANLTLPVTPHMLNNGSMYAHIFFSMAGAPHDPDAAQYKPTAVIYKLQQLIYLAQVIVFI